MFEKIYRRAISLFSKKVKGVALYCVKPSSSDEFKTIVERWNCVCFLDHWWREKHHIPFGSKMHLESNFIDMLFEFEEDVLYKKIRLNNLDPYEANKGAWIKQKKEESVKSKDSDFEKFKEDFNNLDLSKYDEK